MAFKNHIRQNGSNKNIRTVFFIYEKRISAYHPETAHCRCRFFTDRGVVGIAFEFMPELVSEARNYSIEKLLAPLMVIMRARVSRKNIFVLDGIICAVREQRYDARLHLAAAFFPKTFVSF